MAASSMTAHIPATAETTSRTRRTAVAPVTSAAWKVRMNPFPAGPSPEDPSPSGTQVNGDRPDPEPKSGEQSGKPTRALEALDAAWVSPPTGIGSTDNASSTPRSSLSREGGALNGLGLALRQRWGGRAPHAPWRERAGSTAETIAKRVDQGFRRLDRPPTTAPRDARSSRQAKETALWGHGSIFGHANSEPQAQRETRRPVQRPCCVRLAGSHLHAAAELFVWPIAHQRFSSLSTSSAS